MAQARRRSKRNKRSRSKKTGGRRNNQQPRVATKVWHDPHVTAAGRRAQEEEQAKEESAKKASDAREARRVVARRGGGRIVAAQATSDPRELERERLLDRLLNAEGKLSITRAADDFLGADFELPRSQEACLQLLEHRDEERICQAIEMLTSLFDEEMPTRRAVLDSRLRRISEFADEPATQAAANELRRLLTTLPSSPAET